MAMYHVNGSLKRVGGLTLLLAGSLLCGCAGSQLQSNLASANDVSIQRAPAPSQTNRPRNYSQATPRTEVSALHETKVETAQPRKFEPLRKEIAVSTEKGATTKNENKWRSPVVGSPEWQGEQEETARKERELAETMKICKGC
jgi:hypothetical protein